MPTTVAITGASGLIGSALIPALVETGRRVIRIVRGPAASDDEITWNPAARLLDERRLARVDVVVNLAGETIGRRWTDARRRAIRESRVRGTETIVGAITRGRHAVTLINASAVGFYGDRGDEVLDEKSPSGRGYLAEVCREWESAALPAASAGGRVVILRNGVALAAKGGALPEMLRPFKLGVGGRIGNGRQWLAWIDLEDMVRAIIWVMDHPTISGPVNVVAPNPVTNAVFTRAAAEVLHKPALVPVPALALKLMFGEMASETLLASQRAIPSVLTASGFEFLHPEVRSSLMRNQS
ncbi:MAG TPA: TIGR01777 family oxidoreductase [Gemmatimonadaceae bacterium]|nr:TIGR01777 family oxidoreductase [Gemmatimonadaceae bacterium]